MNDALQCELQLVYLGFLQQVDEKAAVMDVTKIDYNCLDRYNIGTCRLSFGL